MLKEGGAEVGSQPDSFAKLLSQTPSGVLLTNSSALSI